MIRIFRGNDELKAVKEHLERDIQHYIRIVSDLESRVRVLEIESAQPRLQALVDDYRKFGGAKDYRVCGTYIREWLTATYVGQHNAAFTEENFRQHILTPQKAKWADEHECPVGAPTRGRK